ncbi:MAG TPA: glycoside hydrolase family 57 protein [Candidatus Saccharimonadales bacterium]|nr:glycoside hydrolase family 57 protein [Candidatus Saccharimonadales bacterium]
MSRSICLYLHVHQPFRVRNYSIFQAGHDSNYWFDPDYQAGPSNERIIHKVAEKSYRPTNALLKELLATHPHFSFSLSITGTLIDQLQLWAPDVIADFQELVATGRVEIVAETYHHSLAFFYSREEFARQVDMHRQKIKELFGVTPKVLRNTELSYNNDLAYWADEAGYKGIITEGWDKVLGWRSPNFMYRPAYTKNIRLLLKNYKLSDDIAFRFSNRGWEEWPLTAEKYVHWLNALPADQELVNLFMDYETFGEHQWEDHGIFDFMRHFPAEFIKHGGQFRTLSDAIKHFEPVDTIDSPHTITWADTERDLTAWLGNAMQTESVQAIYSLEKDILATKDLALIEDWRRLQTSDHFYYMCTKWFNDGDVHAYFSPYESPYEAFMYYSNAYKDLKLRLMWAKPGGKEPK